jgi:CCR4-NOT transcriptional complex subunit CAF120
MNEAGGQALNNVLSVSTAANNRYLFHFSTLNSLTQWTAAIRLAMFENTSLQEAYTGSLVAGKGKTLNSIRQIMERSRFNYEDWARVRFGAGTPWKRCWFVVSPPDEKEIQKAQKAFKKIRSPYAKPPVLKGTLKFYESKRITKKTKPIATITESYAAYAVYPQSRPLIEQSTLVKIEGRITIHAEKERTADGFVFVMPETHAAVSGFEILLKFLFPVWDTFALYGRPNRLVAEIRDIRGLMFAMPKGRRYGYLEILDISNVILQGGSTEWTEREWRKKLKELTSARMDTVGNNPGDSSELYSQGKNANSSRSSLPVQRNGRLRFEDSPSGRNSPATDGRRTVPPRESSVPPHRNVLKHQKSMSEGVGFQNSYSNPNLRSSMLAIGPEIGGPPAPPPHGDPNLQSRSQSALSGRYERAEPDITSNESSPRTPDGPTSIPSDIKALAHSPPPPQPVQAPPTMSHGPGQRPARPLPQPSHITNGKHARMDTATMNQMHEISQAAAVAAMAGAAGIGARPLPQPPIMNNMNNGYEQHQPYNMYSNPAATGGLENQFSNMTMGQQPSRGASRYPPPTNLASIPASPYKQDPVQGAPQAGYFPTDSPDSKAGPPPPLHGGSPSSLTRKAVGSGSAPNSMTNVPTSNASNPQNAPGGLPLLFYDHDSPVQNGHPTYTPNANIGGAPQMGGFPARESSKLGQPFQPAGYPPQTPSPGTLPGQMMGPPPTQVSAYGDGIYYPPPQSSNMNMNSQFPPQHNAHLQPSFPVNAGQVGGMVHPGQNQPNMSPSQPMLQYGGQTLPYSDVMAMRKRDLNMYGLDYVRTMERAPQIELYRERSTRGSTSPQDQMMQQGQGQGHGQY